VTWVQISLEFFRKNCLILSKESLVQTLAKSIRILIWSSTCNILLLKREVIFLLKANDCCEETVSLLNCKEFWTQRKGIPVWFRLCKMILQDSENLKRVAWGLDIDIKCGRTSIKTEFAFSLPSNFFNLLHFIFALKKFYLNHSLLNLY